MRLLHVTHQYRPAIGGAEKHITDLSEELARRGHSVDVFTSRSVDYHSWRSELPAFERLDGVDVHRFASLPRGRSAWRMLAYGFRNYWRTQARRYEPFIFCGSGPLMPGMFWAILRHGRRYDLMHISNLHYSHAYTAYVAAHILGLPTIITPHVHAEQRETHDVGYLHSMLSGSHAVLADTQAEKEYLLAREWNSRVIVGGIGLRLDRYPALDPGESRAQFGLPQNGFVVLFLGRKADYKGLDVCLEAFCALRRVRQDAYFLAVGPETPSSERLWERYRGLEGLRVCGSVSDETRLAALAACDVLAMPSVGEAFGIVYLEAWAYDKPVIAARIKSVSSIVSDGQDGFLIEPGGVAEMAGHLSYMADHPDEAKRMGTQGRAKLERRYTVQRIGDIVEGTYARVMRRHRTMHGLPRYTAS
ncbi:MAG: glycosyltransferase family 4 protein [Anaerolineales bacterium]|nr:glycosyltransferase family 4 protein [Anaerolineales bacterium]